MNIFSRSMVLPVLLTIGLVLAGCSSGNGSSATEGGILAPDLQLKDINGQSVSLSNFRGKPVLLNFWATWCPPCRYELPFLQEIYGEWSERGLVLLTIDVGESTATVKDFVAKNKLTLPVLLDTKRSVAQKYAVTAYPTTFFIDREGMVKQKIIGAFPSKEALEEKLLIIMP